MSLLIASLLLTALFNVVFSDDPDIKTVERIIANANQFFRDSELREAELGEFFITPILFEDGRISQLDTMELQEDPLITKKTERDGVRYDFNLKIGLQKLVIKYRFEVYLPLISTKGVFWSDVGNNSFHAEGHVFVGNDGNCSAVLNDAYVNKLDDYQVEIDPSDVKIPFIRRFYERILNKIVHREFSVVVSLNIQGEERTESFQKKFNEVVCSGLQETP